MRRNRGFTLIEMLVSLTIVGMIAGVLTLSLSTTARVAVRQDTTLATGDRLLLVDAALRHRLRDFVLHPDPNAPRRPFLRLASNQLSFVSALNPNTPFPGPHVVRFDITRGPDSAELWLEIAPWQDGRIGPAIDRTRLTRADALSFAANGTHPLTGLPSDITLRMELDGTAHILTFALPRRLPLDCLLTTTEGATGVLPCPEGF